MNKIFLNHSPRMTNVKFQMLLKHASDAWPLIKYQLSPFRDYGCRVDAWIEGETSREYLYINTRGVCDPLDSKPYEASVLLTTQNDEVCITSKDGQFRECLGSIEYVEPQSICDRFCDFNAIDLKRIFYALCDYHEGAKAIRQPF